jgi:predicted GNAT family acetyltransferase
MIKLQNIIKQIITEGENAQAGWQGTGNEPDEIVEMIHRIAEVVLRSGGKLEDYVRLVNTKVPQLDRIWWIHNLKKPKSGLVWAPRTQQWYSTEIGWNNRAPVNPKIVDAVVKNWITVNPSEGTLQPPLKEGIDEKNIFVNSKSDSVSISYRSSNNTRMSVASIDRIEGNDWWVSRVLVGDRELRGQGVGSILLTKAIQEVLKHDPQARITVEPGGYEGQTEKQFNFYKKNGFVDVPEHTDLLIYQKKA